MVSIAAPDAELEFITPLRAAQILRVRRNYLYSLLAENRLAGVKDNKTWRVSVQDVRRLAGEQIERAERRRKSGMKREASDRQG